MSNISSWSNSAGGNTAATPNGWPEGQSPSSVNDCAREMMAALRRQHESAEWIDYGWTPTMTTTSNFTLAGDRTTQFHVGRRLKCSDSSILYGTISDTTYSANTRVSVALDSGTLSASLTGVAVSILSFENQALPASSATAAYAAYARSAGFASSATNCTSANYSSSAGEANAIAINEFSTSTLTNTARLTLSVQTGDRAIVAAALAVHLPAASGQLASLKVSRESGPNVKFTNSDLQIQGYLVGSSAGAVDGITISDLMQVSSSGSLVLKAARTYVATAGGSLSDTSLKVLFLRKGA